MDATGKPPIQVQPPARPTPSALHPREMDRVLFKGSETAQSEKHYVKLSCECRGNHMVLFSFSRTLQIEPVEPMEPESEPERFPVVAVGCHAKCKVKKNQELKTCFCTGKKIHQSTRSMTSDEGPLMQQQQ